MSYTFVGDAYDRTTPIEMTQVNPEPALPAKPTIEEVQALDIEDLSHISLHQVKSFLFTRVHYFEQVRSFGPALRLRTLHRRSAWSCFRFISAHNCTFRRPCLVLYYKMVFTNTVSKFFAAVCFRFCY